MLEQAQGDGCASAAPEGQDGAQFGGGIGQQFQSLAFVPVGRGLGGGGCGRGQRGGQSLSIAVFPGFQNAGRVESSGCGGSHARRQGLQFEFPPSRTYRPEPGELGIASFGTPVRIVSYRTAGAGKRLGVP